MRNYKIDLPIGIKASDVQFNKNFSYPLLMNHDAKKLIGEIKNVNTTKNSLYFEIWSSWSNNAEKFIDDNTKFGAGMTVKRDKNGNVIDCTLMEVSIISN